MDGPRLNADTYETSEGGIFPGLLRELPDTRIQLLHIASARRGNSSPSWFTLATMKQFAGEDHELAVGARRARSGNGSTTERRASYQFGQSFACEEYAGRKGLPQRHRVAENWVLSVPSEGGNESPQPRADRLVRLMPAGLAVLPCRISPARQNRLPLGLRASSAAGGEFSIRPHRGNFITGRIWLAHENRKASPYLRLWRSGVLAVPQGLRPANVCRDHRPARRRHAQPACSFR
jgi:hypothetical protein